MKVIPAGHTKAPRASTAVLHDCWPGTSYHVRHDYPVKVVDFQVFPDGPTRVRGIRCDVTAIEWRIDQHGTPIDLEGAVR